MKKSERIISFIMLFVISLSNVATPVSYAAELGKIHVKFPDASTQQATSLAPHSTLPQPDYGSVLGTSTSLLTVGSQQLNLSQGNVSSAHKRIPVQMQQLAKKVYRTDEDVTLAVTNPDNAPFTTVVRDSTGAEVPVPISESNNGTTTTVNLAASNTIKPGAYQILVTDQDGNSTTQDFSWGVLALNFDKSMYHPNQTGDISMAVLNDKGDMVCDAAVTLRVTSSALRVDDTLSTDAASSSAQKITVNPQCQKHDFSLQPDYEAHYQFGGVGTYQLQLTATTQNGTHTITDSIQVKNEIPFDIQRSSATRIYPPNTYPMTFHITAHKDFSGTVTETVPESFTITPASQAATQSYTDMQTMYLNSNDPAVQLQQAIAASSSGGLVMPFHGSYPITQGFGAQLTDPILQAFYSQYGLAGHDGVDFGLPMHTPLYAVDEGDVVLSGPGDYGTTIIIQHPWGKSYYGHLSSPVVTVGSHVFKGQLIGYSGESGEATGPHLHFGMKPNNPDMKNGYYGKVNPLVYLPFGHAPQPITALAPTLPSVSQTQNSNALTSGPNIALAHGTSLVGGSGQKVLGASDSASSLTSVSPSVTISPSPTETPTPSMSLQASPAATVSASPTQGALQPTPTPSLAVQPTASSAATQLSGANQNFTVLDKEIRINEQLANNAQTQKVKVITWHVSLKTGESTVLGYQYQTPKASPQFYLLGPAKFYDGHSSKVVFQEQRQWQLAADDVGVEWYQNTSGTAWNGYSWQYRKKLVIDHTKVTADTAPTVTFMEPGTDATGNDSHSGLEFYSGSSGTVASDSSKSETGPDSIKFTSGPSSGTQNMGNPSGTNNNPQSGVNGLILLNQYTAPASGTISTLEIYIATAVGNGAMGIYTDSSGSPGTLLGHSTTNTLTTGWNSFSLSPISVTSGTKYWIAWELSSGSAVFGNQTVGGVLYGDATASIGTWNSSFSSYSSPSFGTGEDGLVYGIITTPSGTLANVYKTGILSDSGSRISVYTNFSNLPTGTLSFLVASNSGFTGNQFYLALNSSGVLQLFNGSGTQLGSNGATLSTGTWYRISVAYTITSTSIYSINIYLNGSQTISVSNSSALSTTGSNALTLGWDTAGVGNNNIVNIDDIYVDNGKSNTDTGDMHVTVKRPYSNGSTNNFGGTSGSPVGYPTGSTGHAQYVSERPLDESAYLTGAYGTTEEYKLESASAGDVDISSDYLIADEAWIDTSWASGTSSCASPAIINNGTNTTVSITSTSPGFLTNLVNNTSYPSGNQAVGMTSCTNGSGTHSVNLYEAGMIIAYSASNPSIPFSNFPVMINLSSDSNLQAHAQLSGNDILFTDSTGRNLLNYEIEYYNSGSLVAWVKIPSLSPTVDTIIYMYYGNPAAPSQASTSTWNSNYAGVWHFANGTTLSLNDATSNSQNGINNNGITATTGQIDGAAHFNGTSQYMSVPNSALFNPGSNSFSGTAWINTTTTGSTQNIMEHINTDDSTGWAFFINSDATGSCTAASMLCFYDGTSNLGVAGGLTTNTWYQVGFVKTGTTIYFYVNGAIVGSQTTQSLMPTSNNYEFIGADAVGNTFYFSGDMDELEYSQAALTPGWITTEYNNQSAPSSFYTLGSVETDIYAPTLDELMRNGKWFDSSGTEQPFNF